MKTVFSQWTWVHGIVLSLLLVHGGLLAWIAYVNSPTLDEVAHLPAGISHWQLGKFDLYCVNPPLVRMIAAIPVLFCEYEVDWDLSSDKPFARNEFAIGRRFAKANGMRGFWLFTLARWACIPISMIGACVCFRWASDLYGTWPGLLALTIWTFSPNIMANGAQITPDLAAAAFGCLAGYWYWKWLLKPTWWRTILAGICLGIAELSKTTWSVLFALWPILWIGWLCSTYKFSNRGAGWRSFVRLSTILFLAIYLLNFGYAFEGSFKRLGDYQFVSATLRGGRVSTGETGNRFRGSLLGKLPLPFPENYIRGIDIQKHDFERGKWSYLRGEQKRGGWWYYYLYGCAIKVPIGTWLIGFSALFVTLRWRAKTPSEPTLVNAESTQLSRLAGAGEPIFRWGGIRDELILLAPAIVLFVLVSSQTGFNRYLRYVLPAFPFLFIWISKAARSIALGQRKAAVLTAFALLISIVSSLAVYPHSLSYFNRIVGGPEGGHAHLVDGNIDWGQDLLHLKHWIEAHPEARDIKVAYFGFVNTAAAGIKAERPPYGPTAGGSTNSELDSLGPQPGWYAVSVNHIRGYRYYGKDDAVYAYFQEFEPVAMAGYSIYIYHISFEQANAVRGKLGLPPLKL